MQLKDKPASAVYLKELTKAKEDMSKAFKALEAEKADKENYKLELKKAILKQPFP